MNDITKEIADAARARVGSKKSAEIEALMGGVGEVLAPVLKDLRARIEELEARNDFVDRGVWKQGLVAAINHGVTHEGSYWIAQKATMARPGDADSGWRLAVKRGRDGKDVR